MKHIFLAINFAVVIALTTCEPPVSKRPLVFHNWPPKNSKQLALGRNNGIGGKQRTLVVQIRSDQPVPLVLKGRPGHSHAHLHTHSQFHHAPSFHSRPLTGSRPMKFSAPVYLKGGSLLMKQVYRKPLKIKLPNTKLKSKPSNAYDKPFQYELPASSTTSSYSHVGDIPDVQKLPLETHANFISDHFAPIHTIPAPNLALHDNHIHHDDYRSQQQQQEQQHQSQNSYKSNSQYEVTEHQTNDHTIRDPFSGSQKLFAPDPDPSLPTSKLRPAFESYNQPSNGKPLPTDVQSNFLPPVAQPLVQIVGAQQQQSKHQPTPEIYPIQFSQPALYVTPHVATAYNPTYLVTQSNNLYTQHQQQQQQQQQLFKSAAVVSPLVVEAGYVNADLTQEVASNGQILQAAKDPHNNIHPVLDSAPQFAALIAAPVLGEDHQQHQQQQQYAYDIAAPFRLQNVAAAAAAAATTGDGEGGFVVSNFYGGNHIQDSSQLLQAYAEEEAAQKQQLEAAEQQQQQYYKELQLKQEQQLQQQLHNEQEEHQLLLQQQQNHLLELQQLQQQHQQHEQQQQHEHQQQQQQQQQHQQQQHQQQQQQHQQQQLQLQQQQPRQKQQHQSDSTAAAAAAFEEHQRLVQQQLGDTPLRIFVPDDSDYADGSRIQKRSDNLKKGTVEDANDNSLRSNEDSFEVSTSVEVTSDDQKDDDDNDEQQQQTRNE